MVDIPDSIKGKLQADEYEMDSVGMSESSVLLFPEQVLKIQENSDEAQNEVQAMRWLKGKLSVPEVIAHECRGTKSYLLMTKAEGKMACEECYLAEPEKLTVLLAQALRELWRIDISACPFDWTLDRKLAAAQHYVDNHLVDVENSEPDTYGPGGFRDPEALLSWLKAHKPKEELVFSHGDFCLPNILISAGNEPATGTFSPRTETKCTFSFIDLVRSGVSDKWQDIALCYRSLKHNYSGKYGGKEYPGYDPGLLFEKLGITPDWEKIRYYSLLDELF